MPGVPWHTQILADQLALFQPGGKRLCPPNYYWHTRIFRPSNGPENSTQETTWNFLVTLDVVCLSMRYQYDFGSVMQGQTTIAITDEKNAIEHCQQLSFFSLFL